ncbi:hypothetical protein [Motiliproteus sp.]|uniref:hypothetical protein n=1 Tax=Motiliproteus sp. TaxID=1898955 RepID=UPI003BAD97D5
MRAIKQRYRNLSSTERKQLLFVIALLSLGAYLLLAAMMWEQMFQAEKLANRKQNRIDVRIGNYEAPEIDPAFTQDALDQVNGKLRGIEQQLLRLNQTLLPLDAPDLKEQTKLELTRLATGNQIQIVELHTLNGATRELPEELQGQAIHELFRDRPYFRVLCRGGYFDFIRYIDSLDQLSFRGFIRNLQIQPGETGPLEIQFELQM